MEESKALCQLCGEPMPPGEEMFFYHGYSCDCPKPPLPKPMTAKEWLESRGIHETMLHWPHDGEIVYLDKLLDEYADYRKGKG